MEKFLIAGRKRRQTETSDVAEQRKIERREKMPEISPSPASSSAHAISAPRVDQTKFYFPNDMGKFVGRALSVSDKNDILCCWTSPSSYSFPLLQFGQQRRCF